MKKAFILLIAVILISGLSGEVINASAKALLQTTGQVEGEKIWVGATLPLPRVWFKLFRSDGTTVTPVAEAAVKEVPATPDGDGRYLVTWDNITLSEAGNNPYIFIVKETNALGEPLTLDGYVKTEYRRVVTNTKAYSLTVRKVWAGNGPQSPVSFQFYQRPAVGTGTPVPTPTVIPSALITLDGTVDEIETTAWTGSINLPAYDANGNILVYTVEEGQLEDTNFVIGPPANYRVDTPVNCPVPGGGTATDPNCWIFTNTYTPPPTPVVPTPTPIPVTNFTAYKVWSTNSPATKPAITFQLYRAVGLDGTSQPVNEVWASQVLQPGTLSVEWKNLPAANAAGTPYVYSFREQAVTNYVQSYSTDGRTVTNTYVPPKISITVNKYWTGTQYPRPTIQIKLYQNGNEISTVQLSNTASYTWANMDQYDPSGVAYVYTVDEPAVPTGYTKTVSGYTITNTYVGPAYTGDDRSARTYAGILAAALAGIGLLLYLNSRRNLTQP